MDRPIDETFAVKPACEVCHTFLEHRILGDTSLPLENTDSIRGHLENCSDCRLFEAAIRNIQDIPQVPFDITKRAVDTYFKRQNSRNDLSKTFCKNPYII